MGYRKNKEGTIVQTMMLVSIPLLRSLMYGMRPTACTARAQAALQHRASINTVGQLFLGSSSLLDPRAGTAA
jgi:hypothetical protein